MLERTRWSPALRNDAGALHVEWCALNRRRVSACKRMHRPSNVRSQSDHQRAAQCLMCCPPALDTVRMPSLLRRHAMVNGHSFVRRLELSFLVAAANRTSNSRAGTRGQRRRWTLFGSHLRASRAVGPTGGGSFRRSCRRDVACPASGVREPLRGRSHGNEHVSELESPSSAANPGADLDELGDEVSYSATGSRMRGCLRQQHVRGAADRIDGALPGWLRPPQGPTEDRAMTA